ncbi:hypothetical protein ABGV42_00385 [Paenibacillus pabuli]|uniref:hypothetical protein n=1 Tax=Paenibacillus pabuli TaxID=1472 RepID=UPI003241F29F
MTAPTQLYMPDILKLQADFKTDYYVAWHLFSDLINDENSKQSFIHAYSTGLFRFSTNTKDCNSMLEAFFMDGRFRREAYSQAMYDYLDLSDIRDIETVATTVAQLTNLDQCKLVLMVMNGLYV